MVNLPKVFSRCQVWTWNLVFNLSLMLLALYCTQDTETAVDLSIQSEFGIGIEIIDSRKRDFSILATELSHVIWKVKRSWYSRVDIAASLLPHPESCIQIEPHSALELTIKWCKVEILSHTWDSKPSKSGWIMHHIAQPRCNMMCVLSLRLFTGCCKELWWAIIQNLAQDLKLGAAVLRIQLGAFTGGTYPILGLDLSMMFMSSWSWSLVLCGVWKLWTRHCNFCFLGSPFRSHR